MDTPGNCVVLVPGEPQAYQVHTLCSVLSAAPMQGNWVSEVGVVVNDGL